MVGARLAAALSFLCINPSIAQLTSTDCTPSSTMAPVVNSPRECCIKTVEHSGTAGGTTEIIAGVPTYVSRPQSQGESRKIVLFFADVYGPFFLNSLLLMDYWASHGAMLSC